MRDCVFSVRIIASASVHLQIMFKLESYITPIILSYVDKYIKNFRPEDSQVTGNRVNAVVIMVCFSSRCGAERFRLIT